MLNELRIIARRLTAADRTVQKEIGSSFLLRSTKWVLGFVLFCFALDVVLHLEPTPRVALLSAMSLIVISVAARTCYLAYVRKNPLEHTARLLESRDPSLGSKLINLLQLQQQADDASLSPLTRDMAKQAIAGYAEKLEQVDFRPLAKSNRVRVELKKAAWASLAFFGVLGIAFKITWTELPRFADPFGDHPPYSFTQLEITEPGEKGLEVIYRKNALIKVKSSGHTPDELFLTFYPTNEPTKTTTVPMFNKGQEFYQEIENIQSDLLVFAHTKNRHSYSKKRQVTVLLTPKLEKAFVRIAPPAYTSIKPDEKPYQFKNFRALVGSTIQFRLQSNRPLREGTIERIDANNERHRIPLKKSGPNEVTGEIEADDSTRFRFSLVDVDGIASEDLWEGSLTITHDLAPEITISNPSKDCFVSMDFKMEAQIDATDDYGIKMIRIHRALNQVYSAPKVVTYDSVTRNAHEILPFIFADLGVRSGDVISFFAEAIDTAPEANLARSDTINVTVISEDEYNTFLRQEMDISDIQNKYGDIINQLHERVEEQRKLGEGIEKLKEKAAKADSRQKEALERELDRMLAQQNELNQNLNKLAERMENFVRTNPVYDVESELQNVLTDKAKVIRESTQANDSDAKEVAAQSSPASGSRQVTPEMLAQFKQASDEQVERLAGAQADAEQQLSEPLEDLAKLQEVLKNFNQFEQLYNAQQSLAEQARAYNRAGPLSREDQLALKNLAAAEKQIADELKDLQGRLRENADAARDLFPKAAQSATDLADKMEDLRLSPMAQQATGKMLSGDGEESFQLSDRLRGEMEKLFGQCKGGNGEMSNELDRYLQLQRGMQAGRTFQQMLQSRKLGNGQGKGFSMGQQGEGKAGQSGYAVTTGSTQDVFGNESAISKTDSGAKRQGKPGFGPGGNPQDQQGLVFDKPDVVKGANPVNRKSDAVDSETTVEEYRTLVEEYFKAITK